MDAVIKPVKANRSLDVILKLRVMEGKKHKDVLGLIDPRMFTGETNLHVKMNTQTTLWHFEYENGILPSLLRQQFTSLPRAIKFAKDYFVRRNIEIKEIVD